MNRRTLVVISGLAIASLLIPAPPAVGEACESEEVHELQPDIPDPGDGYGSAVDIDGGIAVIGALAP